MAAARAAHRRGGGVDLRQPAAVRPDRGPRRLPARPRRRHGRSPSAEGVDLLFVPSGEEMYPDGAVRTSVTVAEVSEPLEGRARPTHFAGVATVVAKLFAIVGPCPAYFGEKDFQQVAVVRQMVRDLSIPVEVVACPTLREPDGLAMSSRNAYLTPGGAGRRPGRARHAPGRPRWPSTPASATRPRCESLMADLIDAEPLAELDYAEVVDARTLQVVDPLAGELRLLAAVRFGKARLIDNLARPRALIGPGHDGRARQHGRADHVALPPLRRRRAGPVDRRQRVDTSPWPTSTCSCWARAWPGCRPRCGPPRSTACACGVLTKAELQQATTRWAQGGVAAVLGGDPDSTDLHLADTLAAGAGLCDVDAVRVLVDEGPSRVHELIALGATFDRDPHGELELAREGGHSLPRIVHAGGAATGAEIERTLVDAVRAEVSVVLRELVRPRPDRRGRPLPRRGRRRPERPPHRGAGRQRARRHRRLRAAVRRHHQPGGGHRRRRRHGDPGRRGGGRRRVRAVPPHRPAPPGDAAAAAHRGAARPRRAAPRRARASGSSTSCCRATR